MAEPDERYERALRRLLGMLGTVDPASAALRSAMEECEAELPREGQSLPRLQRLVALNSLVQDAVGRERDAVARQLVQVRAVRESLAQALQPGETGDSCDVRG
jgi:hypothetical protein